MVDYYYAPYTLRNGINNPLKVLRNIDFAEIEKFSRKIKEISLPTLIIWGENDTWIPVASAYKFEKDIKNSRLVVIPDRGHAPQEEEPADEIKAILSFL